MQQSRQPTSEPQLGLNDVLFILFKHKGKILLSTLAGFAAAAALYFLWPGSYVSEAKLLVRYVLDRNTEEPVDSQVKTPGSASYNDNLIASEVEILTSWDLAEQVAESVSVQRLIPSATGAEGKTEAAYTLLKGLEVTASKGSNVILISYKNRDPELAVLVLQDFVNRYFVKHLEVHRSASAFDYVSKETDQVRTRLGQVDDELKALKAKAGIISLPESTASLNAAMAKSEEALHTSEADEAEQRARVAALKSGLAPAGMSGTENTMRLPDKDVTREYQFVVTQVSRLQQANVDLLTRFTPESHVLKINQAQIEDLQNQKRDLEKKYPALIGLAPTTTSPTGTPLDLNTEQARLAAITGRLVTLKDQLRGFQEKAAVLAEIGPKIAQLEQRKAVEEANYKYFQGSLEKARIDEALDPAKMPNISVVQKPSPAMKAGDRKKILIGLAVGGLLFGLALAFLIEQGVDRTVKRAIELEHMQIPRMLSIPRLASNGHAARHLPNGHKNGAPALLKNGVKKNAPWDDGHFIRPFCESLRDRLILYFQLRNMTHKPKLVAVTGCAEGAGASTLAGGLAAALSETGDGKVLLVDMNAGHEELHPFFEGRLASSLTDALQSGSAITATSENLYLARAISATSGEAQIIPKKFYDMVPRLKGSDFDYIIFDMPPMGQSSTTLAMAGFMDKVLLVVEAEKSNRDAVRHNYAELAAVKANVSTVLNKSRTYGPKWLQDGL